MPALPFCHAEPVEASLPDGQPRIRFEASVDLVYLDPPFNPNAAYNVLFKETSDEGSRGAEAKRRRARAVSGANDLVLFQDPQDGPPLIPSFNLCTER